MSTTTFDIAAGDDRTTAQFFFEVGYSAAWADAYMANGKKAAFPISDESLERAWAIAPEAHDDREEWDRHMAATQAAWQPIDRFNGATGPGNTVLVAVTGGGHPAVVGEAYFNPKAYDGTWWWAGTHFADYHASPIDEIMHGVVTHFMPMPPAPSQIEEG